jgi:hypothetical protein
MLSISETSRVSGASRNTLQPAIRNGRLPLQGGRRLAVVDLKRSGYIAPPTAAESLQAELVRANREKTTLEQE